MNRVDFFFKCCYIYCLTITNSCSNKPLNEMDWEWPALLVYIHVLGGGITLLNCTLGFVLLFRQHGVTCNCI